MAFRAGIQLSERQNPGESTVFVLKGSVWLAVLFTVVNTDR